MLCLKTPPPWHKNPPTAQKPPLGTETPPQVQKSPHFYQYWLSCRVNSDFYMTLGWGDRGSPKILKIFLGFPTKNFEKSGGFTWFPRRGFARGSGRLWRFAPQPTSAAGRPLRGARQNPQFFNFFGGTPKKFFKILGVPLTPKSKNANFSS